MHCTAELCLVVYFASLQALELLNWKDDTAKAQPAPECSRKTVHSPHKHPAESQIKLLFALDKNVTALALQLPTAVKYVAF